MYPFLLSSSSSSSHFLSSPSILLLLSTANLLSLSLAKSLVDPLPGFSLLTKTDPCYWFYFCLLLFFSLSLFTCTIFVFFVVVVVVVGKLLSMKVGGEVGSEVDRFV